MRLCGAHLYTLYFTSLSHKPTRVSGISQLYNIIKRETIYRGFELCFLIQVKKPDG